MTALGWLRSRKVAARSWGTSARFADSLAERHAANLDKRPILGRMLSNGVLLAAGDALTQQVFLRQGQLH